MKVTELKAQLETYEAEGKGDWEIVLGDVEYEGTTEFAGVQVGSDYHTERHELVATS